MTHFRFWAPALFWMSLVFLMSTAAFSSQNTSLIIEPILRFLAPSLSRHRVAMIRYVALKLI